MKTILLLSLISFFSCNDTIDVSNVKFYDHSGFEYTPKTAGVLFRENYNLEHKVNTLLIASKSTNLKKYKEQGEAFENDIYADELMFISVDAILDETEISNYIVKNKEDVSNILKERDFRVFLFNQDGIMLKDSYKPLTNSEIRKLLKIKIKR